MATQEEMLAELRALNAELGLPENDGIESSYEESLQELRALDEELASTPESFDEYVARRKEEDSRSLGEKTSAFTDSFITGAGTLAEEGGRAIKQLFAGDVGLKEAKGVFQVGIKDFGRFAKTLGGAAMDNFYSDENEMRRNTRDIKITSSTIKMSELPCSIHSMRRAGTLLASEQTLSIRPCLYRLLDKSPRPHQSD